MPLPRLSASATSIRSPSYWDCMAGSNSSEAIIEWRTRDSQRLYRYSNREETWFPRPGISRAWLLQPPNSAILCTALISSAPGRRFANGSDLQFNLGEKASTIAPMQLFEIALVRTHLRQPRLWDARGRYGRQLTTRWRSMTTRRVSPPLHQTCSRNARRKCCDCSS